MTRELARTAVWFAVAVVVLALCGHRPEPTPEPLHTPSMSSPAGGQANPFTPETWG